MIDLNKFKEIIREKKEIFIAPENGEPMVLMSLDKYQELKSGQKINLEKNQSSFNQNYVQQVKQSIISDSE